MQDTPRIDSDTQASSPDLQVMETPTQERARNTKRPTKMRLMLTSLGILALLLVGAGLLTMLQLVETDQSLQQRAATAGRVELSMSPSSVSLAPGQETTITLNADAGTLKVSAVDLGLTFSPDFLTVLSVTPTNPFSVILRAPTINANGSATFAAGTTQATTLSGIGSLATVRVKAGTIPGTTSLAYSNASQVAAFENTSNVGLLTGNSLITVLDEGEEPGEAYYFLNASYRLDGVNRPEIQIPTEVSLRYTPVGAQDKQSITYSNKLFMSAENNHMTIRSMPLDKGFDIASASGEIEVLIKPQYGLRKLVGTLPAPGASPSATITADFTEMVLRVGDVAQSGVEFNRISLVDISDFIRYIGDQADLPVTAETVRYDFDHNGLINTIDLDYLLTSFTETIVQGDAL